MSAACVNSVFNCEYTQCGVIQPLKMMMINECVLISRSSMFKSYNKGHIVKESLYFSLRSKKHMFLGFAKINIR